MYLLIHLFYPIYLHSPIWQALKRMHVCKESVVGQVRRKGYLEYIFYWSCIASVLAVTYYFVNKGPSSQGYGFSNGHVWMWELDYKESWAPKNWCFWTVVLEKTLESPLDCKEIQPVHSKGNQSWVFTGRTDVEAETPICWPPDVKSWLIWKDPDVGKRLKAGGEGDDRGWDS